MTDHRHLLLAVAASAAIAVAAVLVLVRAPWLPFAGQVALTLGSIATIVPAAFIGARMLRLLDLNAGQENALPSALRKALEAAVLQPRPWHYWLLLGGLSLLLAGSILALAGSWPSAGRSA